MPDFDKLACRLWDQLRVLEDDDDGNEIALFRDALIAVYNEALETAAECVTEKREWTNSYMWPTRIADEVRSKKVAPLSAPEVTA